MRIPRAGKEHSGCREAHKAHRKDTVNIQDEINKVCFNGKKKEENECYWETKFQNKSMDGVGTKNMKIHVAWCSD